ncbi:MAG: UvrD/REP helicase, partial [uncultured bacterium]
EAICFVARTNDIVNRYREHFSKSGLPVFLISRDAVDKSYYAGIRFATMHRVKGLEFDYILMASASKDIIPLKRVLEGIDNVTALEEADLRERALLYVAVTRAKKEVIITCNGEKSEYL